MWYTATQDVSEGLEDARARRPSVKAVICSTVKALVGSLVRAVGPVPDGGGAKRRSELEQPMLRYLPGMFV